MVVLRPKATSTALPNVDQSGQDPLFRDLPRPGVALPGTSPPRAGAEAEGQPGELLSEAGYKIRLDHLGKPVKERSRTRYKHSRSYTILYDARKVRCRPRFKVSNTLY